MFCNLLIAFANVIPDVQVAEGRTNSYPSRDNTKGQRKRKREKVLVIAYSNKRRLAQMTTLKQDLWVCVFLAFIGWLSPDEKEQGEPLGLPDVGSHHSHNPLSVALGGTASGQPNVPPILAVEASILPRLQIWGHMFTYIPCHLVPVAIFGLSPLIYFSKILFLHTPTSVCYIVTMLSPIKTFFEGGGTESPTRTSVS